jgi:hypothetical protein
MRDSTRRKRIGKLRALSVASIPFLLTPAAGSAEVVGVEVESREDVLEGQPFGEAGPYEKITGRIRFAFDPDNPFNAAIVDLARAPRSTEGRVEAWANFMVLQPKDPALRRGVAWVEVSNRGGKASLRYFNNAGTGARDPVTTEDFGSGLLMRQGLTVIWVGWQWDMAEAEGVLRLESPIVPGDDGLPLTGLVRSDWTVDEATDVLPLVHRAGQIPYPVADPAAPENELTVRDGRDEHRRRVGRELWRFVPEPAAAAESEGDGAEAVAAREGAEQTAGAAAEGAPEDEAPPLTHIQLDGGFEAGRIYELVYLGQDPRVVGLGLAAIRDVISYAKYDPEAVFPVQRGIAFGVSQTGRFLRHFLYQGFNVDEEGRTAYDGMLVHTAGAGRGSFNHRFGQPSRDAHRYSAFFYPTDLFPFTSRPQTDAVTGVETFYTNTGYEYWGRAGALIHHAVDGTADVEPLPNERIYHLTSGQHTGAGMLVWDGATAERMSGGAYRGNPLDYLVNLSALAVALVEWVADGVDPPPSRYPTLAAGTMVAHDDLRYPHIPGLVASRVIHTAYRADYGDRWAEGIVDVQPPRIGSVFPSFVSDVDELGNEVAGIRPVEVRVPLGTYLPWNLREGYPGGTHEMVGSIGTFVPLPATENVKMITADPRPSLEALYGSRNAFLEQVRRAAEEMVAERLLLDEDVERVVQRARTTWNWIMGG